MQSVGDINFFPAEINVTDLWFCQNPFFSGGHPRAGTIKLHGVFFTVKGERSF